MTKPPRRGPASALRSFLRSEAAGGILLMIAAVLAMLVANSGLGEAYEHALHAATGPVLTPKLGPMTAHLWINDGLMAVFFLLVGLEIKREMVDGRLSTWERRRLPFIAAAAGMAIPALIYLFVARGEPALANGWAIPAATDIAFAIGVLAILGPRVPASVKLFVTTVAIVDDMGAVAIIALFYTQSLDLAALGSAVAILAAMLALNRFGVRALWPYLLGFALLWYALLVSGVHATIAGVLAAACVPIRPTPAAPDAPDSPLHRLEHALVRPVAFFIVPLFGFANAGVSLSGVGPGTLLQPLPLGIALGLFLGKQLGIFGAVWAAHRLRLAEAPADASWVEIYGAALLCGIGFTMSLFIGGLAFPTRPELMTEVKLGVLGGSLLAALAGYALLRLASGGRNIGHHAAAQRAPAE
ncbi:MAG: Na+/H+ antiporter NhaA type [uncultured Sphingomonadaceae bacterium]|uniref:Na(+)/H(+) antiporter NhaA n=1 Tax=uncultured Sphingomonadaceae bacterium TaxID=169976 RepID=A0A6J4SRL7_9SPHN|nr:MAG: Na+/H+ antiporter NhaA type [uncultured Sphingomonadaceae bacterium]